MKNFWNSGPKCLIPAQIYHFLILLGKIHSKRLCTNDILRQFELYQRASTETSASWDKSFAKAVIILIFFGRKAELF